MKRQTIGCVKAATNILGDKWTPQLLRYLFNEKSVRFCQIQNLVDGINPRTLSARLDRLEQQGVIEKVYPNDNVRCEYRLTEKGQALKPILHTMDAWSASYTA